MVWGTNNRSGSSFKSCDALLRRLESDDPTLTELVVLPLKSFGDDDVRRIAVVLRSKGRCRLASLKASGHAVSPEALEDLGRSIAASDSPLTALAIGSKDMGDRGAIALCRGLRRQVADEGATEATVCNLQVLDLSYKSIGMDGLSEIISIAQLMPKLHTIDLSRNLSIGASKAFTKHFADMGATAIFRHVRHLDLSVCDMNSREVSSLISLLVRRDDDGRESDQKSTMTLRLHRNPMGGESSQLAMAAPFGSRLLCGSFLTELHLSECQLDDDDVCGLCCMGGGNKERQASSLRVLDLSRNKITSVGLAHLILALQNQNDAKACSRLHLNMLEDLNLAGNDLSGDSVTSLARAMEATSMKRLDLAETNYGTDSAVAMLRESSLVYLNFFNNKLGDHFTQLADAMRSNGNGKLEYLDLGGNGADRTSVASFLERLAVPGEGEGAVPTLSSLKVLVVGGNAGGPDVEAAVRKLQAVLPNLDVARDQKGRSGGNGMNHNVDDGDDLPPVIRNLMRPS